MKRAAALHYTEQARIAELEAINAELVAALLAIYNRHNTETMAQARAALAKAGTQ